MDALIFRGSIFGPQYLRTKNIAGLNSKVKNYSKTVKKKMP